MTGNLYIDGNDAYSLYSVFVTEDGYNELLAFPAFKSIDRNNWAEEDGEEFDLSAPVLDARELSIKFSYHGVNARFGEFLELLSDKAYHNLQFLEIGKTYRLRLIQQPNMALALRMGVFTLRFSDDFPMVDYNYVSPQSSIVPQRGIELDERPFSDYGVYVLQGSDAEILKSPAAKKNLLQNIKSQIGAIYDGEFVFFQTKEVKLNCLLRAYTLTEFWRNYNALLYDLSRPGERLLYMDSTGDEYPCFYKGCTVSKFSPVGKIWFQFTLALVFTSYRVEGEDSILASEDDKLIITEEDDNVINLLSYAN